MTSRSVRYFNPLTWHMGYRLRRWALLGAASTLMLTASAGAEGNAEADSSAAGTYTLDPHVVTTTRLPRDIEKIPYSVDELSFDDLAPRESGVSIDESLRRLPGLFVSNRQNLSQGDRLSIRGIGSRTSFGVRGVRVLLDHIPLTMPDGQSQLSNVDLGSVGRVDIMRGATSALYGNAAGGVVHLHTRDANDPGTFDIEPRLLLGSYGLTKWQIGLSRGFDSPHSLVMSANRLERDGYRDHADSRSINLNAIGRHRLAKHLKATTILNFYDAPYLLNPSSLALADADTTPRSARFFVRSQGATKQVRQLQGGATLNYDRPEFGRLLVTAYGLTRSLSNPIPGRIIELERSAGGVRSAFEPTHISSLPIHATVGIDLEVQSDDRQEFANGGLPSELVDAIDAGDVLDQVVYGDRQLDQRERVVGIGPFYELQWAIQGGVTVTTGGRYDRYRFEVDDRLTADGIDRSGNRTLSRFSPMLGATFNPHRQLTLFASYTTAFQTPSTVELGNSASSEGGFNDELDPETIRSVELGARAAIAVPPSRPLDFGISLYRFEIDDILVPFQLADSEEVFFRNERRATNLGLELIASWTPTRAWRTDFSYTRSRFEYDAFDECIGGMEGGVAEECQTHVHDDVPGMPQSHGFARLAYDRTGSDSAGDAFFSIDLRWVGEYFANDFNGPGISSDKPVGDFLNPSYWTSDLRLGTRGTLAGIPLRLTIGIDNLFDERYHGSVVPNAFGDRFFEPAPGRTFFLSLSLPYSRTS